ncbi:MAG: nuclear transport factor 2 family protein [Chloroflexi bacterium]|nr:nuclear transport factor 2 family protein [Chloroflexota bacterium]
MSAVVTVRPPAARDEAAIRDLRTRFNAAIAAHDAHKVSECWSNEIHVSTSDGTPLLGPDQVRHAFEAFFADPDFITFMRETERVQISTDGRTAAEFGHWTGRWRTAPAMHGAYLAAWHKIGRLWKLTSELYVPLD